MPGNVVPGDAVPGDPDRGTAETPRVEVIVVDDGSTDGTVEWLRAQASTYELPLRVDAGAHRGPAAARNRGVALARAPRVLFLGDDTRPDRGCIAAHLDLPADPDVAIQGRIDWDPAHEVTPLMEFLAPAGPQFYFAGLRPGAPIPYSAVLGSNLSAPRRWLEREPMDEGFPHAAMEDTEMAWRWRRHGWRTLWRPEARAWHHHRYDDLDAFLARQRRAGRSARHALRRHPRSAQLAWDLVLQPSLFAAVVIGRRLIGRGRATDAWDLACRRALLAGFLGTDESPG